MSSTSDIERQPDSPSPRLGYLLKQAQLQFGERARAALAPLGIDTRAWATLVSLEDRRPSAQAEISDLAGIDRTTLVAVLDQLEDKGLVRRHPDRNDRRRNVIEITSAGRDLRTRAARLIDECEREFLVPLGERRARQFEDALSTVLTAGR